MFFFSIFIKLDLLCWGYPPNILEILYFYFPLLTQVDVSKFVALLAKKCFCVANNFFSIKSVAKKRS